MPRISSSGLPFAYSTVEKSNSRRQTKSITSHSFRARSGEVVTGGPTKAMRIEGLARLIASASFWSPVQPGVLEQDKKLIALRDFDRLRRRDMMRRRIQQPRPLQHASRIGKPHRVPVRFNLTRGR